MFPSKEQTEIIKLINEDNNLVIEAVAGSGKTTTLCLIANANSTKKCCLLTYSRALKDEILSKEIPPNLDVYTFHGFASILYSEVINNDLLLEHNLKNNEVVCHNNFDILMVDEEQYFLLTLKIISYCPDIRLVLVGDSRQTIKEYIGARSEFLTDAANLWQHYSTICGPWAICKLSTSYRLTPANALFVNKHLYRDNIIISGNTYSCNVKPEYLSLPCFIDNNKINPDITMLVKKYVKLYGHQNVLILAASFKINNPGYLLANDLNHISHSLPSDDSNPLITTNKLVFRTFASCKGLQSKCVIILGLDENYFKFNVALLSSSLYVAFQLFSNILSTCVLSFGTKTTIG